MLSALLLWAWLSGPPAFDLVDALGRRIALPRPPQRIVVAGRAGFMLSDAAYVFPQARERFVAVGRGIQGEGLGPILDPSHASKVALGPESGPEQIATLRPDVVLMKTAQAGRLEGPLSAVGIPAVFVDFETPDDFIRDLVILGHLLGEEARAEVVARFFETRRQRVAAAVSDVAESARPSVLVLYRSERDGNLAFNVPPVSWMQTHIVRAAGGRPVWVGSAIGNGWTKVGIEQIAAWDPDRLFVVSYARDPAGVVADLRRDPLWQGLRAVQRGAIEAFPADHHGWDQPTTRWILGLLWLAGRLYPERLPGLDMLAEARTFYRELYGLDEQAFARHIEPLLAGEVR